MGGIIKMEEQETKQENYRVFLYWNNGLKYKFRGESFSPQFHTPRGTFCSCVRTTEKRFSHLFSSSWEDLK